MKYAANTSVSVEKSKAEIETILMRYGATQFASGWDTNCAYTIFSIGGKRVKFVLPLPDKNNKEFTHTPAGRSRRSPQEAHKAWEQSCRQRWRALALSIKAKLEAVDCGITTFEDEFLAHIVLPDGETVGNWMKPQIEQAYLTRKMPPMLLEAGRKV